MVFKCQEIISEAEHEESVDTHGHFRNSVEDGDGRMEMNVREARGHHGIVFHIGNGKPAILDQASADRELDKIAGCPDYDGTTTFYATPLLTDRTTREMVLESRLKHPRTVVNWKAFLSGVSNDGGNSVTDFAALDDVILGLYDPAIPAPPQVLDIHAERKRTKRGRRIPMRDREIYAMRHDVVPLLSRHPGLEVVIKHASDKRTLMLIKKLRALGYKIFAEICPHYLIRCHEDLYEGPGEGPNNGTAFNLHDLCWPLYKDEASMLALREAVLSGFDWVVYGSDWACHADDPSKDKAVKVNADGYVVGGVVITPAIAKSIVIDLFAGAGKLEHLDAYLSRNARRIYRLPPSRRRIRYVRKRWQVPDRIEGMGPDDTPFHVRPFQRGHYCNWKLAA